MQIQVIRVGLKPKKSPKKSEKNALVGSDWHRIHELVVKLTKEEAEIEKRHGIDRVRLSKSNLDWYVDRKLDFVEWACLLCDDFDEIVGVCLFQKGPLVRSCSLVALYVEKKYRGKGYGKGLLNTAIEELRKHYKTIELNMSSFNDVARRLYGKVGFTPYRTDMLVGLNVKRKTEKRKS